MFCSQFYLLDTTDEATYTKKIRFALQRHDVRWSGHTEGMNGSRQREKFYRANEWI